MYYKVMVLEIKDDYCLAMSDDGQILRIKKKSGLQEGDRIYVLGEDLCGAEAGEKEGKKLLPLSKKTMRSVIAVAAALMLCLSALIVPRLTDKVYAVVSVDISASLQVELDKDYKVLKAVSYGNSIPGEQLDSLKGRSLEEVRQKLGEDQSAGSETVLIGYALEQKEDQQKEEQVSQYLRDLFKDSPALYLKGSREDVKQARKEKKSLGIYIASKALAEDKLEDVIPDMSREEAAELLKNQPELMKNKDAKDALENGGKKEKQTKENRGENDKSPADRDDDREDAYDSDDDDDDDKETRPKATTQSPKKDSTKKPTAAIRETDDDSDDDSDSDSADQDDDSEEDD
ncbi:anti-sigma factor domain-containing protein [Anaerovorax odorimutans]|uniref:Anti-sigma factor domain-containing protein n=1 Tax=Anaerovorax odorimutans TaxID=109327 RepID=A0ABT1RSS0_9FIRM|nr:anti-sigma factor domain-containing protein [Anaerovorax odorimutans]MCQ4637916.1 anti-sigma factor domain-containing protein [Anaerovorax odorimutans]